MLAAGELVGEALFQALELHQLHHVVGAADDLVLGQLLHPQAVSDIFPDVHVGKQGITLEHHGDPALIGRNLSHVPLADKNISAGGVLKAGDHAEGRGLSTAGGSQQRYHLAVLDLQVDMVHRHKILAGIGLLEDLCDILQNHAGAFFAESRLFILIAHFVPSVFSSLAAFLAWGTLERGASSKLIRVLKMPINTSRMTTSMVTKAAAWLYFAWSNRV